MKKRHVNTARWAPVALAVVVVAGIAASQQGTPQVAYVNLRSVMEQTPGYETAQDSYEVISNSFQEEIGALQTSYDSAVTAFQQTQVVLTPTARQEKQQELTQMSQRFQGRANEIQNELLVKERELLSPLEERVQLIIEGIRAERNVAMIFDVSAQVNQIISADTELDLTGLVVQRLSGGGANN